MTFDKKTQVVVECAECANRYVIEKHDMFSWSYRREFLSDGSERYQFFYTAYCFICCCMSNVSILEGDEHDIPQSKYIFEY